MNKNKSVISLVLLSSIASFSAFAEYTGAPTQGEIQINGEIVNAACGLSPNSSPVQVEFGQIPTHTLAKGERAGNVTKNIELQGCDTSVAKTATVTYIPVSNNVNKATLAAFTSGTAGGAGIGLKDSANVDVVWGNAMSVVSLVDGTNKIPFVAYLQSDNSKNEVTPGAFQSTINFKIDYQ